jgi:tripartite-type tricarboxylate transporter receptor subunit TctC
MNTPRRQFHQILVAIALATSAGLGMAQGFPTKPLRIVVGAPPGGTADLMARVIGDELAKSTGQPVVVDNKPGGAGVLGLQEQLKSPHDGHTMLLSVNGLVSEIPHAVKLPIDPLKELKPVIELARTGLLFVGNAALPVNSVKDAVAQIKANPGKVSYASYSPGSLSHTLGLEFNRLMGTDMVHVGYRGSPPALADLVGGHVAYMFDGPATSIPMAKGGKIRILATTAPQRLSVLPDVPTFAELGYKDLTETAWMGMFVTPDVPAPTQARLRELLAQVMALPAVRQRFTALGLDVVNSPSSEELQQSLVLASERQAKVLKNIGFKIE